MLGLTDPSVGIGALDAALADPSDWRGVRRALSVAFRDRLIAAGVLAFRRSRSASDGVRRRKH